MSEWISVDERLPDDSHDVLMYLGNGHMLVGYYDAPCNGFRGILGITNRVTHWMPLPEVPKMKGGAG